MPVIHPPVLLADWIKQTEAELKAQIDALLERAKTTDAAEADEADQQSRRAKTEAEADEILAKLELTLELQGNDVVAKAKYPGKSGFSITGAVSTKTFTSAPARAAKRVATSLRRPLITS